MQDYNFYVYKTTTDKLAEAFEHIETTSAHRVLHPVHVGGRDWVLICARRPVWAGYIDLPGLDAVADKVERGALEGIRKSKDAD
jgi:hypothetical protein